MGLVLPNSLAWVLDMIGIEWPNIDEDELKSGAEQMRQLADELTDNTGQAKSSIEQMLSQNSSRSLELFEGLWQKLSGGHLPQLAAGIKAIGTALDASAVLVIGMKIGAIVQLGVLAAEIIADQVAAPFTFGASEAAIPGEVEITSQLVKQIFKKVADQVEQVLLNAVEGPIFDALGKAADELAGQLTGDATGTSSGLDLGAVTQSGEKALDGGAIKEINTPGATVGAAGTDAPGAEDGASGSTGFVRQQESGSGEFVRQPVTGSTDFVRQSESGSTDFVRQSESGSTDYVRRSADPMDVAQVP